MTEAVTLVIATKNSGKLIEIDALLKAYPVNMKSLSDFGPIPPVEEDGATFDDNAYKKAAFTARVLGLPALADDSGLVVPALGGGPGIHSARYGGDSLIVDCGPIGPDYQPGHAHCDTLSFELCVGGSRVVVDSGVYDYEVGPMRDYARSTRAHNTVMVDGVEQSEIWGGFRVARRARPLCAQLSEWQDGQLRFRGAHDGYHRIGGGVNHEREFAIQQIGRWEISDRITGRGQHRIESFIHFHPSCAVQELSGNDWRITVAGGPILKLSVYGGATRLAQGWYCPEFGKRLPNTVLVIECEGRLPIECGYVLERMPAEAP